MRIAYYVENPGMARMTALSIASVRVHMPDAWIVQLSPESAVTVIGVDARVNTREDGYFFARRARANALLGDRECLFPDSDTIFRASVSGMFMDQHFDVALPEIDDPSVRYSAGIVFSRSARFWSEQAAAMPARATEGGQPSVSEMLRFFTPFVDNWDGAVRRLPEAVYERVPRGPKDPCDGAAIIHYRGPRKRWMPGYTGWEIERVFDAR